ncbi:hypothetical protein, partial [Limosilactobacillus fermentum]
MASRKEYKYSIISYNQNLLRNETINIGILIFEENEYKYKILPNNSSKINGLAYSQYFKDLFKENIKLLNYYLQNYTASSLEELNQISKQIHFSTFKKVVTANVQTIFEVLLNEYVGNYYFDEQDKAQVVTAKDLAINFFNNYNVSKKVKKNIRIKPNKGLNMKINIDFAYTNGTDLNLINSVPASENSIDDWYTKMFLLSKKFDQSGNILLLNNSSSIQINEISDMLKDLSSNEKVNTIDLGNPNGINIFKEYINK